MNTEIENAIASDFRKLRDVVERLDARLTIYTGYIGSGKPGRQDAYCSATEDLRIIKKQVAKLHEHLPAL